MASSGKVRKRGREGKRRDCGADPHQCPELASASIHIQNPNSPPEPKDLLCLSHHSRVDAYHDTMRAKKSNKRKGIVKNRMNGCAGGGGGGGGAHKRSRKTKAPRPISTPMRGNMIMIDEAESFLRSLKNGTYRPNHEIKCDDFDQKKHEQHMIKDIARTVFDEDVRSGVYSRCRTSRSCNNEEEVVILSVRRNKLIEWLSDVLDRMDNCQSPHTLSLAVHILDCFCANRTTKYPLQKLQLLGAACAHLAIKFTEINIIGADDWAYLSADAFDEDELIAMESVVMNTLQFKIPSVNRLAPRLLETLCAVFDMCTDKAEHAHSYIKKSLSSERIQTTYEQSTICIAAVYLAYNRAAKDDVNDIFPEMFFSTECLDTCIRDMSVL